MGRGWRAAPRKGFLTGLTGLTGLRGVGLDACRAFRDLLPYLPHPGVTSGAT